eukprot:CAMPEP_0168362792 /NCGR_PEP_ID=MMETSP0228-20121227/3361_1 /TAXON_ID=133427 /ORGANISM="Protoceratium reticulatum, Strain CCCM 535 (=CCMP 1889)" /LENGTH=156 /DNA_ID=CAMNT_0008375505 /DNA_START=68 /DNA_END=534 /DNA_ORIENTATION=+
MTRTRATYKQGSPGEDELSVPTAIPTYLSFRQSLSQLVQFTRIIRFVQFVEEPAVSVLQAPLRVHLVGLVAAWLPAAGRSDQSIELSAVLLPHGAHKVVRGQEVLSLLCAHGLEDGTPTQAQVCSHVRVLQLMLGPLRRLPLDPVELLAPLRDGPL